MKEKLVLVTAGGHIASFHAAMKKMYEALEKEAPGRFELFGAKGGLSGLIKGEFEKIHYDNLEEERAGSCIGADREKVDLEKIAQAVNENHVYAIVMMGGDNHLGEGQKCFDIGVRVVGYPKTMDGDLSSFITLGWETAIYVGAIQTQLHHHTAMTSERVFYVGLFGRNTDWILTGVSAYGGADRAIPCEQEYDWEYLWNKIELSLKENKERYGRAFAVIPYSEGARVHGVKEPPQEHCSYDAHGLPKLQPEWIGMELVRLTKERNKAAAFQAHTYDMRDSPPTETDKKLSRMAGEECMKMILQGDFGKSVVFEPQDDFLKTARKPLREVAMQRKVFETGFFDYQELKTQQSFVDTYGRLFQDSLGNPPEKDQLVYKHFLRR